MTAASRAVTLGLIAVYVAAWTLGSLALKTTPSDLDLFFWPSAETVVSGHPLVIYSAQAHATYPNANGPLGLIPLIPLAAIANGLGWAGNIGARAALTGAAVSLLVLLLTYQSVRLVTQARGTASGRVVAACCILLAPALWIGVIDYGHVEQPLELCLVLFAVSCTLGRRAVSAGVGLGAAVLTRSIAGLCVIPLVLRPLATRRMSPALTTTLVTVVTVALGLAPFVIADSSAVVHSLLTYRGSLPIGGGSFWVLARQTSVDGLAEHADVLLSVAAATVLTVIVLRRNPALAATASGILGLLTVTACCFPLFAKTVYPYYFVEPYVFSVIWWLARPGTAANRRLTVPLLLTLDVFLTKAATLSTGAWAVADGVASSVIVVVGLALVLTDLLDASRSRETGLSVGVDGAFRRQEGEGSRAG
jgi:hypothetical protein